MRHNYDALLLLYEKQIFNHCFTSILGKHRFFYLLHLNEIYSTLIGVFKELTTTPSFLCGILFPVWLLIKIILNKKESNK